MGSSDPLIFDISSDEEPPFDDPRVGEDDLFWLRELLETVDPKSDDSDDVVIVGEYNPPKPKSKPKSLKAVNFSTDDDCVVLDRDPDIPVATVNDADSDGDDLLIVGQKGQVACRDYPHSRHLCAKFPFSSTPHEKHCVLCHCYVCDSVAPCTYWGTGLSSIDHCHATDKQQMWKIQRENFRLKKDAQLLVSNFPDTSRSESVFEVNQVVPVDNMQLRTNSLSRNQLPRHKSIRACSNAGLRTPGILCHGKKTQPKIVQRQNGLPHTVPNQDLRVQNRSRRPVVANSGLPSAPANTMFKRPGIIRGALTSNRPAYSSSNSLNCPCPSYAARNRASIATSRNQNPAGQQDQFANISLDSLVYPELSPPPPNVGNGPVNLMPFLPKVSNQPIPQTNEGKDLSQFWNRSQNIMELKLTDDDFSWVNNLNQTDQQTTFEDSMLYSIVANNEPTTAEQYSSLFSGDTQVENSDREHDSWFSSQSVPLVFEGSNLNVISTGPPAVDAGTLCFDFEISWNGLAHS
ncbi:hypothetical protein K2173_013676 [Erythroxylum novogranatense]|uniref:Uncharacterized protein n=1 Tax=Erythroxylum novogranatense TaxID=1862640 RepID=A0AAV8SAJ9_9ROSI|nr:hypothetical protein K2173_013676 [Erythroxylum novogranatense]